MSSSETLDGATATVEGAVDELAKAIDHPDRIADEALRAVIAAALKLYAAKAEAGMRTPLPPRNAGGLTITETMIAVTDLLHALDVQLFELSMWQAMTGNCIAPHQRIDAEQT
jgi:alkylation response protein AidB-like acyl-CoA dehydrogenase